MTQHSSNVEKKIFDKVHFIYSKIFNQSITFDYESKLIQYIVADELFQVTNKNSGIGYKSNCNKWNARKWKNDSSSLLNEISNGL